MRCIFKQDEETYEVWNFDGKIKEEFLDNENWMLDGIADGVFVIVQNHLCAPANEEKTQFIPIPPGAVVLKSDKEEWNSVHNWKVMDPVMFKKECEIIK